MSDVIAGRQNLQFFNQIARYFDFQDNAAFWNRVLFFNYLPDCVGMDDERYEFGKPDQIERAKARFLSVLAEYRPQKVFVFSKKTWPVMPPTRKEGLGNAPSLDGVEIPGLSWRKYDAAGNIVMAFSLRHPERANKEMMHRAVQRLLAMPLAAAARHDLPR
jgi:hypothetical protein